jgi:hypothetical protein
MSGDEYIRILAVKTAQKAREKSPKESYSINVENKVLRVRYREVRAVNGATHE